MQGFVAYPQDIVEPYINKNFNYASIALPKYRSYLIEGGPSHNFNLADDNLELWNILTFKLESTASHHEQQQRLIDLLEKMDELLRTRSN